MWEITLYGKPSDILLFLELKNKIKLLMNKNALVVITFERDLVCSIGVVKNNRLKRVQKLIYQTIIKIAKLEYLKENLNIFSSDKSLNSYFVSSIINASLSSEVKYAMQVTRLISNVHIRQFVQFRLHNIFDLWRNEVDYYNFHFFSNSEEDYLGFLKFLMLNIHTKSDIVFLEEINSELCLLDKHRNKMKKFQLGDEIGIIANLIMYAPKKLIISSINSLSRKVTNIISYIFEDRVSMLL